MKKKKYKIKELCWNVVVYWWDGTIEFNFFIYAQQTTTKKMLAEKKLLNNNNVNSSSLSSLKKLNVMQLYEQ